MALWGKSDKTQNKPKFIKLKPDGVTVAQDASGKKLVLIDDQEAKLADNKKKGIQGPGWYLIQTTGSGANKRVRAELLISLAKAPRKESALAPVDDASDAAEDAADLVDPV